MTTAPTDITELEIVLVVGPMRTGTTFLARLLGSHPRAAYLGFELAEEWSDWTGLPFGAPGADDLTCPPLGPHAATPVRVARVRAGLSTLLDEHVREDDARPDVVVLKNPHLWHRLPFVFAVLPTARVVRTHRSLEPTVASLRRLWDRALSQHDRVHHLPRDPSRCWDFVPRIDADRYDPARTFPGGDVEVLAEFVRRTEDRLDATAARHPDRFVAAVSHEELVRDFDATAAGLARALDLVDGELSPPEPLDPSRLDEWRELLDHHERSVLARFVR